ncbi:Putative ABC-transporter type IV [Butyrivibrio fibrisolvens DSM 3071]|uniref:Putative ABC-transporter type IV n=1 Tax=Butyrivibrio fibrisolvens DSM 3071 TaxID=1121131 RepID=A0A1M5ZMI6_BUTFI|nr:putative ABC transporter permease [Butyrivibrio fibrisolvens]SHI25565.1 Putative ABC-transporter type IV [Butyrivibrio fibrisolvens DSM 3071]
MEIVLTEKDNKQKLINTISDYFECFLVYCFLGWVYESIWCDVIYHKRGFLNRGVLFGPWLPIYGIGFFIILGIFAFLKIKKPLYVFIVGGIIATLSELVASYILEATMGKYMWDYTGYFMNFDSRIALVPGLMFGLLICVAICCIHPAIVRFQNKNRSNRIHKICFMIITALFICDLISRIWLGSNFSG